MKNTINLIVDSNESGQRIDLLIANRESQLSRSRIKNLILGKKLKINEIVIDNPAKKTAHGDKIKLEIPEPKKASLTPVSYTHLTLPTICSV